MLSSNIRFLRTRKRFSQQKWGDLFGLTRGMVDSYERGLANPDAQTLAKIAKHYDISIENLLNEDIEKNTLINFDNTASESKSALITTMQELINQLKEENKFLKELLKSKES